MKPHCGFNLLSDTGNGLTDFWVLTSFKARDVLSPGPGGWRLREPGVE